MEQNNKNVTENEKNNLATEVFHEFKVHSRIAIIAMAIVLAIGAMLYYKNDCDWRELFSSYDFVQTEGE